MKSIMSLHNFVTLVALAVGVVVLSPRAEAQYARLETLSGPALAVGKTMPDVQASKLTGEVIPLVDGKAKWTVVAFLSTRCPCTARYLTRLTAVAKQFAENSVRVVGVNANANEAREDAVHFVKDQKLKIPMFKDADGSVARALNAQATPEIFILDDKRVVRYHGAIDDSLYGDTVHHVYLQDALTDLVGGKSPRVPETKMFGCAILIPKKTNNAH